MPDCLFCKMVSGDLPIPFIYQDEHAIAIADINPQAPTHILVIPRKHLASTAHAEAADSALLGHLLSAAAQIAVQKGLAKGYRLVINTGPDGGQTVEHLHIHLLGGRPMHWPPG
jgi:histidine triad (HIT) family protein